MSSTSIIYHHMKLYHLILVFFPYTRNILLSPRLILKLNLVNRECCERICLGFLHIPMYPRYAYNTYIDACKNRIQQRNKKIYKYTPFPSHTSSTTLEKLQCIYQTIYQNPTLHLFYLVFLKSIT